LSLFLVFEAFENSIIDPLKKQVGQNTGRLIRDVKHGTVFADCPRLGVIEGGDIETITRLQRRLQYISLIRHRFHQWVLIPSHLKQVDIVW
jgi:hypothetical protein